ncbi:hypothetical protein [Puia dinghuensis]|uniref:Uncharacterized protein n=1 Tax=Puia dinghuensis TaxID=1792502 RepID=A0A8J2UDQ6_9BACT|nr:hypothetical protein [Puia dinghuensis]GGB03582.1 hypothetical protein GCM10011511_28600 [Puia dinghuensis]
MKHVDYLYFNIYNYFYRLSLYRQSMNFRTQAMYLFSIGSGGWLLLFESIYLHFIKHTRFTSPMQSMIFAGSVYALTAALFHYIFIVKDRDQKIFGKYEGLVDAHPKQRRHLLISLSVLALPYVALITFAMLFPRPH